MSSWIRDIGPNNSRMYQHYDFGQRTILLSLRSLSMRSASHDILFMRFWGLTRALTLKLWCPSYMNSINIIPFINIIGLHFKWIHVIVIISIIVVFKFPFFLSELDYNLQSYIMSQWCFLALWEHLKKSIKKWNKNSSIFLVEKIKTYVVVFFSVLVFWDLFI